MKYEEDAISRQAVDALVDELARAISDERCFISKGRSTATIMQDILDLPSIIPLQGWNKYDDNDPKTWPEDGSWGLWQHKSGGMSILRWKLDALNHFYPNPYNWDIDDVVAWMPKPEPYKAESEVKE